MSMNFHLAPEDEPGIVGRSTGPRRTHPAICPACGDDITHPSQFGDPTCGANECRDKAAEPQR